MKTVLPIDPEGAEKSPLTAIDPEMIEAFNVLIAMDYSKSSHEATVMQKDAVQKYCEIKGIENTNAVRNDIHKRKQLDVEKVFEKAGWTVTYDKPAYFETYEPSFKFKKKRKK